MADPVQLAQVRREFRARFGGEPRVFRAPGRVNLIGEHVDYNDGLVLPLAIDRYCYVAVAPRMDQKVRVRSSQYEETVEFGLDVSPPGSGHWSSYAAGVAWALQEAGARVGGGDLLIDSDVPVGAGLSTSAAFEVALGAALLAISNERMDGAALAMACQRAENDFVGARCGVMDQLCAVLDRLATPSSSTAAASRSNR